jgi:hypothetical protein
VVAMWSFVWKMWFPDSDRVWWFRRVVRGLNPEV